jgi:methylmalonyl-CoA/ethylmalonyl-CoA epimerase
MTSIPESPSTPVHGVTAAIAVQDLDAAITRFRAGLGLDEPQIIESAADQVRVAVFRLGESQFHLVSPTSEDSLIAKHIAEHGEGLHHLGFVVDDVDASLTRAREQGLRTLGNEGRPGAGDLRVGFLHPKSAYGAIVELIQEPVRS